MRIVKDGRKYSIDAEDVMDKQFYLVSFKWYDSDIYCANIVHAGNEQAVRDYYSSKYGWCAVYVAKDEDLLKACERGMPIIEL